MKEPTNRELNIMLKNLETKIDKVEENLNAKLEEKTADLKEILARIEAQTTKTNGRVTILEEKTNVAEGAFYTYKWLFGFVGLGTLITLLKVLFEL